jgi:integrase
MVKHDLKGVAKATAKGRTYYYAWRGGPPLRGKPGSPEFHASYVEAHANLRAPDASRFRSLVVQYRAEKFPTLAASTQANWGPWLDRIAQHFGDLSIAQFERPEKIRPLIIRWRNRRAATPRTADYGLGVLSAVLSYAVDPLGKLAGNPCEGIKLLYSSDRSETIWTDTDMAQIKRMCAPEIVLALNLAAHTGLRLGDLVRLSWSHIGEDAIVITTGKSNHKREAIIPLYDALRDVLKQIPKRSTTILTNRRHQPWRAKLFASAFVRAKHVAGMSERDLHFHDLRGTAATRFYTAGLSERVIAEIMGWEEEHVARIIRRYVGRTAATKATIRQINQAKRFEEER